MVLTGDLNDKLEQLGYTDVETEKPLPFGISMWAKRLGYWVEDKNIHEYLVVFVQEIESQGLVVAISPKYLRAHRYKKMKNFLAKKGVQIEASAEYEDINSIGEATSIMRKEVSVKRIDYSKNLRV
jgi:hypothetical protein